MRLKDYLFLAWRRITIRPLEAVLIVLGIVLGTVVLIGIFGLFAEIQGPQTYFDDRSLRVVPNRIESSDYFDGAEVTPLIALGEIAEPAEFTAKDVIFLSEALKDHAYVFAHHRGGIFDADQGQTINYMAVTPDFFQVANLEIIAGVPFSMSDLEAEKMYAILGRDAAISLFDSTNVVGQNINLGGSPSLEVIGILDLPQDVASHDYITDIGMAGELMRQIFVPLTVFNKMMMPATFSGSQEVNVSTIYVQPRQSENREFVSNQINETLTPLYGQGFRIRDITAISGQPSMLNLVLGFSLLGGSALLVAAVNIMNLLLAKVLRREKAIGLLKSLGATKGIIFKQFLAEVLLLGIIGGGAGVLAAYFGLSSLDALIDIPLRWSLIASVQALAVLSILLILFGSYPSLQASAVDASEALRGD